MTAYPTYEILVMGNSAKLDIGFLGISNSTLIKTDDGYIVFDVGGSVTRDALIKALADQGLSPRDIKRVFLSHLHSDHVLNIDLFPHSTEVILSRREFEYAAEPHVQDIYIPWCIQEQLKKYNLQLIEGTDEIAPGVRYFPAPGHTPGCYAIKLSMQDGRSVTIAGDAVKFPTEAIRQRVEICFDTQAASAATIKGILESSDLIIPGHYSPMYKEDGKIYMGPATADIHYCTVTVVLLEFAPAA